MERYQDYGPSGHRNRLHAGQHQSQVCYVPLGLGLRFSLRCGEFQVLVGFRGEGGGESGVGVKNLESFGAGIWRPLLAPSTYAIHSKGTFLASKFRDSNVRKKRSAAVFWGGVRGGKAVVPSPRSRGSVLTLRQRSPQSQVVDRASGFLEQGLVGTVMTWK